MTTIKSIAAWLLTGLSFAIAAWFLYVVGDAIVHFAMRAGIVRFFLGLGCMIAIFGIMPTTIHAVGRRKSRYELLTVVLLVVVIVAWWNAA